MLFVDGQEPVPKPVGVRSGEVVVVVDLFVVPALHVLRSVQAFVDVVDEDLGPLAVAPYGEGGAVVHTMRGTLHDVAHLVREVSVVKFRKVSDKIG